MASKDTAEQTAEPLESGMVVEDGLLIYRTGRPLPADVVDEAIERARAERVAHIQGERG